MSRPKKMQTWLIFMSLSIVVIITVFHFFIWGYTCQKIIVEKTQLLFDEVNYQYAQQINDRVYMCEKIADRIKGSENIKNDLLRLNSSKVDFYTGQSYVTSEVMKQLNTVSLNLNMIKGVRIHLPDGRSILCYRNSVSPFLDIDSRWAVELQPRLFDYKWDYHAQSDKLYMFTYIIDGTRIIALLELELSDHLFSEIVFNRISDLEMSVAIRTSDFCYSKGTIDEDDRGEDICSSVRFHNGLWALDSTLPARYIIQEMWQFSNLYILFFGVFTLLLMLLLWRISYSILSPLNQINLGMEHVKRRNWRFRMPSTRWVEFNLVSSSFNEMTETLQNYLETIDTQNKKLRELETLSHAAKFNPHFIFNTLDMIRWELELANRPVLGKTIVDFSNLLRYSVSASIEVTSIQKDFHYIENYLSINKGLMGEKFNYSIKIEENIGDYATPKLLIQPLLENSLKYAFDNTPKTGIIWIRASAAGSGLNIEVSDNGRGMPAEVIDRLNQAFANWSEGGEEIIRKNGLGLYLVNNMIKHYYGMDYGITLHTNETGGLTVVLYIARLLDVQMGAIPGGEHD